MPRGWFRAAFFVPLCSKAGVRLAGQNFVLAQAGDDAATISALFHGEVRREPTFLVEGAAPEKITERFVEKLPDVCRSQLIAGFRGNPGSGAAGL